MTRHYALLAIIFVAGCSNQSDKQRIAELEKQIAQMQAQQQVPAQPQDKAPADDPKPIVWTTEELTRTITNGMTKADVKAILGPPDYTLDHDNGQMRWSYVNRWYNPDTEKRDWFYVHFEGGRFNKLDW